jgi:hypothetical protein
MILFKKLNNLIGWIIFLIASFVYIFTSEPTTSFWDCGEYIATAYKLQVGHPPGAPLFQMLGRFFALFAFGDTSMVARMINTMSALFSSFTILFLFWTINMLARKLVAPNGELTRNRIYAILGSGIVGAMAYAFSDSFWFSAVEGEVYAMSSFFTALVFWAILKWESVSEEKYADRWILLIAYLIGLSIGVHLLNLLAIPAITFVIYFKKYQKINTRGILLTLVISFILLAVVMFGIIPETLSLFANTELLFVNTLHLPFHSGTIFFAILLISLIVVGIMYTQKGGELRIKIIYVLVGILTIIFFLESRSFSSLLFRILSAGLIIGLFSLIKRNRQLQNRIILGFTLIVIGYTSFLMLVIRSNANTPIDENNPEDAISLIAYLNREQYGDWPLLYGEYYNAPVIDRKDGTPVYVRDNEKGKYVVKDHRKNGKPVYDPKYTTFFPRMWNSQETRYVREYKKWAGIHNDPGNKHIPTFKENLRFFFRYQLGHMYFRYFMWNYTGRQNEIQGNGELIYGNWVSGVKFIDEWRLGPQDNLPYSLSSKARNKFYFLPLILGLIGLIYQFRKKYKDGLIVALLFIMMGIAIVVYLNQNAPQPRERDYAYAASFYAFSIWIGLGVLYFVDFLSRKMNRSVSAILATIICFILVPVNMAKEGWDDHNRSGRYTALQMAKIYLNSCAPNAILFTNGDNDTFPLWYAQEVEGFRTDVRVCNLSLLNADWYIDQMLRKAYDSEPIPFSLSWDQYKQGTRDVIYFVEKENVKGYVDLKQLFKIVHQKEDKLKLKTGTDTYDYFPTKKFMIKVDSAKVVENNTVPKTLVDRIENVKWKIDTWGIQKNHLMVLDMLAHNDWNRPIYFSITTGDDAYIGLQDYFFLEGMAYRLLPVKARSPDGQIAGINTDVMYDNLMNKFFIDLANPKIIIGEDNLRASMNLRNIYGRLAKTLVLENKKDSAVQVCDRIIQMIPDETIPFDYFIIPVVENYYGAGDSTKANKILNRLIEITEQNLDYYFRFTGNMAERIDPQRQQNLAMMQQIAKTAQQSGQNEIAVKAKVIFDKYYQRYLGNIYRP